MYKVTQLLSLAILSSSAEAYIGPGMGGGFGAAILGILAAILIAIFGFIYYPLKKWWAKRKKKSD